MNNRNNTNVLIVLQYNTALYFHLYIIDEISINLSLVIIS